jgi:hypothetical protein
VQAAWSTHLHTSLYHSKGGRLARLGLSSSLADSLWALGLVRSRTFSGGVGSTRVAGMKQQPPVCKVHSAASAPSTAASRQTLWHPRHVAVTRSALPAHHTHRRRNPSTNTEDINGESLTLMVPFCDLANHAPQHNSTFCLSKDAKG